VFAPLDTLYDAVTAAFTAQPPPPPWLVGAAGLVALLAVLPRRVWRVSRHAVTIAHEGGHALTALLTGRRLTGIRLHADTSGLTVWKGRPTGPGMVFTLLAGYVAPSLLGLGGAALLVADRITLLLWLALILLPGMLVMIRNAFGVVTVVTTMAAVLGVTWYGDPLVQAAFADLAVWFLLFGGVRPVPELQRLRRRGWLPDSDADQLARLTGLPAGLWVALFGLVNVASLLLGAWWLLGAPTMPG